MINLRTLVAAAGAALLLLAPAFPAHGQVMVNRGINPWTGTPYRDVTVRNPWTGRVRTTSTVVNPWTGMPVRSSRVYNPRIRRPISTGPVLNPWTNQPWGVDPRRGWWW
jgi:hypothetical protein